MFIKRKAKVNRREPGGKNEDKCKEKLQDKTNYSTGEPHMSFLVSWILLGHGSMARTSILQRNWGLGNTAGAEILEGDILMGFPKTHYFHVSFKLH